MIQKGIKIILPHGFIKKIQKTPRKEIERELKFFILQRVYVHRSKT
jgi:phage-related protein